MNPESTRLAYRPDIDGLRAVAVLLVVAEHLGVPGFAGGYVGVDVFFVISGYLICLHLLRDIEARRFSLLRFYDRRVRRILPAFLAMVLAVNLLGYRFMLPPEMHWAADTEQGALLSMSNMSLMKILSYFAPQSRTNPLLHTWSLGVEEQFYFVFPLLLFALLRWLPRKWVSALLLGLAALSLGEANKWLTRDPAVGFYFAPLRAWELLAGAVLAVGVGYKLRGSWERNLAAAVGLVMILWPGFTYNEWTRFPGWHAVPPVLGAVLIIAAGELGGTFVGAALGWAPIRWVGVISYSLYLWHWPLAVFQTSARIVLPDRFPQWEQKLAVFVASLAVAALSWRFVEQPFRTGSLRRKPWVRSRRYKASSRRAATGLVVTCSGIPTG